jgi:hypothetical protein
MRSYAGSTGWVISTFAGGLISTHDMSLRPVPFGAFDQSWLAGLYTVFVLIAFAGTEPRDDLKTSSL